MGLGLEVMGITGLRLEVRGYEDNMVRVRERLLYRGSPR
jgi:hypothetical protein